MHPVRLPWASSRLARAKVDANAACACCSARRTEAGVGWTSSCAPIDCGAIGPAFGFPADWRTACSNCAILLLHGPACAGATPRPRAAATSKVAEGRLMARRRICEHLHDVSGRALPRFPARRRPYVRQESSYVALMSRAVLSSPDRARWSRDRADHRRWATSADARCSHLRRLTPLGARTMSNASAPVFRCSCGMVSRRPQYPLYHNGGVGLGWNGMFQIAVSAAMATDLLVCFPTSTRARANDVGIGSNRVSNQNTGTNYERFHCLSLSWCRSPSS